MGASFPNVLFFLLGLLIGVSFISVGPSILFGPTKGLSQELQFPINPEKINPNLQLRGTDRHHSSDSLPNIASKTRSIAEGLDHTFCRSLMMMANQQHDSPLGGVSPSAMSIWGVFARQIHQASRLPQDSGYVHQDLTAQLLQVVSPRLPNSVKTVVRGTEWELVDGVLHKASLRYDFLKSIQAGKASNSTLGTPPPVQILVMGGSVTRYVGWMLMWMKSNRAARLTISTLPASLSKPFFVGCNWPYRSICMTHHTMTEDKIVMPASMG
jgi:hypothetical protein